MGWDVLSLFALARSCRTPGKHSFARNELLLLRCLMGAIPRMIACCANGVFLLFWIAVFLSIAQLLIDLDSPAPAQCNLSVCLSVSGFQRLHVMVPCITSIQRPAGRLELAWRPNHDRTKCLARPACAWMDVWVWPACSADTANGHDARPSLLCCA